MPPLQNKTAKSLVTLAALPLLAAASLATGGSAEPGSFLRTEPFTLITGVDQNPWCEAEDDASVIDEPADLRGPHFSLSLACLFGETSHPRELGTGIPELEQIPPAGDGTEFVIAQFALQDDYLPEYGTDSAWLETWIEAGGERIELAELPESGQYLVLIVPVGAEAVLRVADGGREQGLDLRTGGPLERVAAYYDGPGFWEESDDDFEYLDVDFATDDRSWSVGCHSNRIEFTRSMWLEKYGWAPEGSVYLEVEFWWCTGKGVYEQGFWTLDSERSLFVTIGSEVASANRVEPARPPLLLSGAGPYRRDGSAGGGERVPRAFRAVRSARGNEER